LDVTQRDDSLKYINAEKRLSSVEDEVAEINKKLIESEQEKSKELAEMNKKLIGSEQEKSKELAETKKKLIELEQEQSNPVPKNIRGKY
jgi:hypothetical protein